MSAVALNVTMVEARAAGFATVWPCGTPMPDASNVNFGQGGTAANGVIAPVGADGTVCIYTSADAHLIVDISGWFTGGETPAFTGNIPQRLVDTRNNIGPAPRRRPAVAQRRCVSGPIYPVVIAVNRGVMALDHRTECR